MTPAVEAGSGPRQGERVATALVAGAGITLLALRSPILGSPSAGMQLAGIYLMLGIVSVAVPVATKRYGGRSARIAFDAYESSP